MKMTAREIVKKRLNHQGTDVTPYSINFEGELYKRLTEYYKDENWEQKKLRKFSKTCLVADTVLRQKIDDTYSKDAYGVLWRMDKKPWHIQDFPIKEPEMGEYRFPSSKIFTEAINQNKAEAIKRCTEDTESYQQIYMGWGIFDHTWHLRGFENSLTDLLTDEDFCFEMTQKITDIYVDMIRACADIPADAIHFCDDYNDQRGVIMGRKSWLKYFKPCWERIYKETHSQGKCVIQHSCGSIVDLYDDLHEIGMDCHESVQPEAFGMEPSNIKEKWGEKISFWGCLGSQGILTNGTPAEIRSEILRLDKLFKDDGGYVLAPAKPLLNEMEIEKAVAVIETFSELNL